jgi:CheY-like chemotaxis protein/HPt (histidine-containing phosphotransfer) domain-containing protein
MILEHTCKDWGIEFVGIGDGRSAIQLIESSKPFDVIIVDYHMPHLNGIETIKMIREQLQLTPEKQPIILLHSSSDDIEIYEECKNLGVVFNLTKPLKSKELHYYLRRIHQQSPGFSAGDECSYDSPDDKPANISSPVILVAEDVVINMILVTTLIKQMVPNVTVIEAKNGKEAYEMTISKKPDLIIMDLQMPVMSGIEATLEIRKMEPVLGIHVPIVALTAGAIQGEKERCLEAGMDDFLTKPLDQNTLQRILGKHLTFFNQRRDNSSELFNPGTAQLHFDQQKLMESIGNSRVILAELLDVVPLQFANDIASLHNAINERKLAEVKSAAYSIKGTSLNMWFNKMADLAREIESLTDQNHLNELEEINKELVLEWELIKLLLKNIELS